MKIDVVLSPREYASIPLAQISQSVCVVLDILRATSAMVTAFANGAESIVAVSEISEALEFHGKSPTALLAGERHGLKISSAQTGSIPFHLGNSPREMLPEIVRGKTIVTTTTNGTRAIQLCRQGAEVLIGSFLNLSATARYIRQKQPAHLLIVCSGTGSEAAFEDSLAAGAFCAALESADSCLSDSAELVFHAFAAIKADIQGGISASSNAQRLLQIPELAPDVAFCAMVDQYDFVATLGRDGHLRLRGLHASSS